MNARLDMKTVVVLLLILAAVWMAFLMLRDAQQTGHILNAPPPPIPDTGSADAERVPTAPISAYPFTDRRPALSFVHLQVETIAGAPIAGAYSVWLDPRQRCSVTAITDLIASGPDGCIDIPWESSTRLLSIYHPSFQSAHIDNPENGAAYKVTLLSGRSYRANFKTRSGVPVVGVTVNVSLLPGYVLQPEPDAVLGVLPGADPKTAIRCTLSDASGTAIISGLSEAAYFVRWHHSSYLALEMDMQHQVVADGDAVEDIIMAPVYAAVVDVIPSDAVPFGATFVDPLRPHEGIFLSESEHLRVLGAMLGSRHGVRTCMATILSEEAEIACGSGSTTTPLYICFEGRETQCVTVPLRPIATITAPDVVLVDPEAK